MKFKKWLLAAVLTLSFSGSSFAAVTDITVNVDGNAIAFPDAKPFIDSSSNRTMIPIRFVSEKLGAAVQWDEVTRTVKMDKGGKQVALRIGEKKATVAGKQITFDAAAVIQESRTFVPLRFVSEAYGIQVVWDKVNQAVHIVTKQKTRDAYGTKLYQQFHSSLKITNGMLAGKMPKKSDENLLVHCEIKYTKPVNGKNGLVLENGESFQVKVSEIESFGFLVYDRAKGKVLVEYSYRSLPELVALDVVDR